MANIILTEGSGTLNQLIGAVQVPLASYIDSSAEAHERASVGLSIFTKRKSTNFAEGYGGATGLDDFSPVGEGGAYPLAGFADKKLKTLHNETWKQSVKITREMLEDSHGNFERIVKQGGMLSRSYYRTLDRFLANLIGTALTGATAFSNGTASFDTTSYDGKCLFSAAHTNAVNGAVQSNAYTDSFSVETLGALCTAMQNFTDDKGNTLGLNPDTIIIPNDARIKQAVFAALGSDKMPGTSHNDLNYMAGAFHVMVWPELNKFAGAQNIPYILLDSSFNADADCAVFQEREPLEISDKWDDNDAYILRGRARFTGGFVDWRGMCAGGLSFGSSISAAAAI